MTEQTQQGPVVIVGAGPVGLFLALELGRRGLACVLLEARPGHTPYPRANTHTARSMEHYRRLGLSDRFRQLGLPAGYPNDVVYTTRLCGHELARVTLPNGARQRQRPGKLTPEPTFRASQMHLEALMLEDLAALPTVSLCYGHEVERLGKDGRGVFVEGRSGRSGPFRLEGAFLVGCDGPRSIVRQAIGSHYRGDHGKPRPFMGGRMRSAIFRSKQLYARAGKRRAWQYWVLAPGLRAIIVAIDGKELFLFHTQLEDDAHDLGALIRSAAGADIDVEIVRSANWQAGLGLVADRYQRGRIFIAGDAAHLFTPTGGFGLNTGIDDVANLAWKLAASLEGWGGPELLASYALERRPIGVRNTLAALDLADAVGACPLPDALESPGDGGAAARALVGDYLRRVAPREFRTLGVQLGARYDASPIVVADGSRAGKDSPTSYRPSARPGGRLPHYWRGSGRSLLDEVGPGLTLFRVGQGASSWEAFVQGARRRGVPFRCVELGDEAIRHLQAPLVLVRPDQHVAWRGAEAPRDVDALFDAVLGGAAVRPPARSVVESGDGALEPAQAVSTVRSAG